MLKRLKIWMAILSLLTLLIVCKIQLIVAGLQFLFYTIIKMFSDPHEVLVLLDFQTVDLLISVVLILILPILSLYLRNKFRVLNNKLSLLSLCIIIILTTFIFAPIITDYHPNYQGSLKVTRFLMPFQSVNRIHFKKISNFNEKEKIREIKKDIVKSAVSDQEIYFDSLRVQDDSLIIFQSGVGSVIQKDKFLYSDGEPKVDLKTFFFGTDELGRDIFSRIVYGSRISIIIGIFSVLLALLIGILFGFIAGYYGSYFDLVISRITDMFLTIPSIFFVIMALAFFGNSLISIIVVLGFSGWMSLYKIVKGEIILIKKKDYFITAKKLGLSKRSLLIKEILPVILVPVVVNIAFQFSNVILAESALSYLGLGSGLNYPSWGSMILSGQQYMSQGWWLMVFPGIALVSVLLTFNILGEKIKLHYNLIEKDK